MKSFKPQYHKICRCSWCRREMAISQVTMHVETYRHWFFGRLMPAKWFQLCPQCEQALMGFAIHMTKEA